MDIAKREIIPEQMRAGNLSQEGTPLLHYAQVYASREEELAVGKNTINILSQEIRELEKMDELHKLQEDVLKNEIRELQRSINRGGANLEYLKNIVIKFAENSEEKEKLLPVIATILQFTPEESKRILEKWATTNSGFWGNVFSRK